MPSLRGAVNAHCRDCIHDPRNGNGTWREQVAQCSVTRCALWPLRPAPESGPYADPPRDPATVAPEWVRRPAGWAGKAGPIDGEAVVMLNARPILKKNAARLAGQSGVNSSASKEPSDDHSTFPEATCN